MSGAPIEAWNTDTYAPVPGQVLITSRAAAEREPDTIVRFLRAVDAAMRDVLADKDLDQTMQRLRAFEIAEMKDLAAAKEGLRAEMTQWEAAGAANRLRHVPERWQQARDLMAKAGVVKPGRADVFYTDDFIDKARA
jgi:ABC-type nitrate/sulfonate/bicarbonate transport system substrate-binding protein